MVTWGFLLAPDGCLNGFLKLFGIDGPNWLFHPSTALNSVVAVQVFKGVAMNIVLFAAALQSVPEEMLEAAQLDGASPWRSFLAVTVPMIAPTILLTSILTTIGSLEVFASGQLLTSGGPGDSTNVLLFLLFHTAFISQRRGYASAIGVILFATIISCARFWLVLCADPRMGVLCRRTSVTVLRRDFGDVSGVLGGDTSPSRVEG
ncbi:carbohydrate ABC transporter permease [Lacisediminihabitans sp. FW035]